jgi:NCAIR mutase (PurE)-related protein
MLRRVAIVFLFYCFPNAIAFLADSVPAAAVPQSVDYGILVLGVTG